MSKKPAARKPLVWKRPSGKRSGEPVRKTPPKPSPWASRPAPTRKPKRIPRPPATPAIPPPAPAPEPPSEPSVDRTEDDTARVKTEPPAGDSEEDEPRKASRKVSLAALLRRRGAKATPDGYPLKRELLEIAEEYGIEAPPKATKAELYRLLEKFTYE